MKMVEVQVPYGSISIECVSHLKPPFKDNFYVVDDCGTKYKVKESIFNQLKELGFQVKED